MCKCRLCEFFEDNLPSRKEYTKKAYDFMVNRILDNLMYETILGTMYEVWEELEFNDDTEAYDLPE